MKSLGLRELAVLQFISCWPSGVESGPWASACLPRLRGYGYIKARGPYYEITCAGISALSSSEPAKEGEG